MRRKSLPEEKPRLPVKLEPTSNGEYAPPAETREIAWVRRTALERIDANARRLGVSRRELLQSTCGAATVLLALNALGCRGGGYNVRQEAELEEAAADETLAGGELIVDVQTHHVAQERVWWATDEPSVAHFLQRIEQARCGAGSWLDCYARDEFLREIFLDSDTQVAVLSALWGAPEHNPLQVEEAARTRDRVAQLRGSGRLLIHAILEPQLEERVAPERMERIAEELEVAAWKLYPVWGPEGRGYWLDDPVAERVFRQGVELGHGRFAIHKGLPLEGMDPAYAGAGDVGAAAKAHPEATFLIYHAGYVPGRTEGPYDPQAEMGIDSLIRGVEAAGVDNVYAELGSLWREVMGRPEEAAHAIGKLLKSFGPDRILWGTDAIWYGSPQDQIQAFRTFEISEEFQERYGYPALTPGVKAKIFGGNALRVYEIRNLAPGGDEVERARAAWRAEGAASHRSYGPRSRREFLELLRRNGGRP